MQKKSINYTFVFGYTTITNSKEGGHLDMFFSEFFGFTLSFDPRQGQSIFPLAFVSRPALRPTQPPIQWVPGVLSPRRKARLGRDADHSPPSSAEVKNVQALYFLSPLSPSWRYRDRFTFSFTILTL
jgi:hypothetical protein